MKSSPKQRFNNWSQEIPLAVAQLSHQKVRLAVALAGIGFANILIFMQLGFLALLFDGVTRVHENLQGDLFLISSRAKFLGDKPFSRRHLYQADAVNGVESARPFYYGEVSWRNPQDKKLTSVSVIAFNPVQPVLDMPEINQQIEQIKLPDTVLFDNKSQSMLGPIAESFTKPGSVKTEAGDRQIRVGGIFSLGSTLFRSGHIVTSDWNYLRLSGKNSIDDIHLGVLTLNSNADLLSVQKTVQAAVPDEVKVMTRQELIALEEAQWAQEPAGVIFNFGAVMGFIVGIVVVYQVLYSDVNDHLKEYATLKAMGYSGKQLLLVLFQEGMILAVLGFLPGCGLSVGMYALLGNLTRIPIAMRPDVALQVLILTITMCMISAAIASRKLQSADPADVF